jgi:hypothetical protein
LSEIAPLQEVQKEKFPPFELGRSLKKLLQEIVRWDPTIRCLDLPSNLHVFVDPIVAASKFELTSSCGHGSFEIAFSTMLMTSRRSALL